MASLALVVALIFLSLILIGPLSYLISLFDWMPTIVKYLLALCCCAAGLWAIFVPVPLFKILGLMNLAIGIKILTKPSKKELKLDKVE